MVAILYGSPAIAEVVNSFQQKNSNCSDYHPGWQCDQLLSLYHLKQRQVMGFMHDLSSGRRNFRSVDWTCQPLKQRPGRSDPGFYSAGGASPASAGSEFSMTAISIASATSLGMESGMIGMLG